jgi:hypothetical protein
MRMMEANYNLHYTNGEGMELSKYATVFAERTKVAEQCGNDYGTQGAQLAIKAEINAAYGTGDKRLKEYKGMLKHMKQTAHERYLAFVFMKRAGYKYEELRIKLENDWSAGINTYPETVDDVFTLDLKPFATQRNSSVMLLQAQELTGVITIITTTQNQLPV